MEEAIQIDADGVKVLCLVIAIHFYLLMMFMAAILFCIWRYNKQASTLKYELLYKYHNRTE